MAVEGGRERPGGNGFGFKEKRFPIGGRQSARLSPAATGPQRLCSSITRKQDLQAIQCSESLS